MPLMDVRWGNGESKMKHLEKTILIGFKSLLVGVFSQQVRYAKEIIKGN